MDEKPLWHRLEPSLVISELDTTDQGLTTVQAEERLRHWGQNVLPIGKSTPFYWVFIRQFISPFIYVLVAAMLISLALGRLTDAVFIGVILLANALIGAIQEHHAQRSAQALRNLMINHTQVIRDGCTQKLDAELLVPGDCVILVSGARVPADIRLLRSDDLEIDESLLTGESAPVNKVLEVTVETEAILADRTNQAFAGTLITSGRGLGLVVSTGKQTEVGQLASQLSEQKLAQPPLLQRIKIFSQRLTMALLVVIAVLAAIELQRGSELILVFMTVTALAVAAIPEGLEVALTVVLSVSMRRMARHHVVVRKLVATESLGSCTVIATDKTGTLTLNHLTANQVQFFDAESPLSLAEIYTGTNANQQRLHRLSLVAGLCNEATVERDATSGEWRGSGDRVDQALLAMAYQITGKPELATFDTVTQIHYEPALGFAAAMHQQQHNRGYFISVKGAVEKLLPMCDRMAGPEGNTGIIEDLPLNKAVVSQAIHSLASQGVRVLALADTLWDKAQPLTTDSLHNLCLLGLVGMTDPLRPEAEGAIRECRAAGIKICMVTGDHPTTALSIAQQLGLVSDQEDNDSTLVTGKKLAQAQQLGPSTVDELTATGLVYARVTPQQKLTIVESLIRQGEFVAVTGDGVNDAPALNASHVGVAMGLRGTDVAREASDLLLTDDNFASVVAGIREGRIAYQNIRKVVFFLISTGAAEVVLFLLASIFAMPIPLTAVQLLWLNLVTSGVQHIGLSLEPGEGDEMQKAPRPPSEPLFNRLMIERVLLSALVVGGMSYLCFAFLLHQGWDQTSARNSTLLLMVLFENVQVLNSRSETRSVFFHPLFRNPYLIAATLAAQSIHIAAMYWPLMQQVLGINPVQLGHWGTLLMMALSLLLAIELHKIWLRQSAG